MCDETGIQFLGRRNTRALFQTKETGNKHGPVGLRNDYWIYWCGAVLSRGVWIFH